MTPTSHGDIPGAVPGGGLKLPCRQLRVLYHHRTQGRGAEGNHIVSVVNELRGLGHHVDVLSPPGIDPFSKNTVPVDKAKTRVRGMGRLWQFVSRHFPNWLFELVEVAYNVPAYFRVVRVLREGNYDLVYERYAFFMVAGALGASRHGVPFLLEINEVSGVPGRAREQTLLKLCSWFERILFRRCARIHAVSSYLAERAIAAGATREQVVMVPNGFDIGRQPACPKRDELRRRYGLDDAFVLGFVGWFDVWDSLEDLVDVLSRLLGHSQSFRLCLVGDGHGRAAAEQRALALGISDKVVFTGAVSRSEVYDYMSMLDVGVLLNSNLFGSPMIMFEMMGLHIPMVLPRLPPIEDVHVHGSTALLFSPRNVEECTEQVLSLYREPALRMRLADAAHALLVEQHSWRRTVERILAPSEEGRRGVARQESGVPMSGESPGG